MRLLASHEIPEILTVDADQLSPLGGPGRGGVDVGLGHGSPAEDLAGAQLVDEYLAAPRVADLHRRLALEEEVQLLGRRSLRGQFLARFVRADARDACDLIEVRGLELREDVELMKPLDALSPENGPAGAADSLPEALGYHLAHAFGHLITDARVGFAELPEIVPVDHDKLGRLDGARRRPCTDAAPSPLPSRAALPVPDRREVPGRRPSRASSPRLSP